MGGLGFGEGGIEIGPPRDVIGRRGNAPEPVVLRFERGHEEHHAARQQDDGKDVAAELGAARRSGLRIGGGGWLGIGMHTE